MVNTASRLSALLLLLGCSTFTEPRGAEHIPAPDGAASSWTSVLDCARITADTTLWHQIDWYRVPLDAHGLMLCADVETDGCFHGPHDIYLLETRTTDVWLQAHELLHFALHGDPHHTSPAWDTCALR